MFPFYRRGNERKSSNLTEVLGSVYLYDSALFQMDLLSNGSLSCLVPKSKLFPQHQTDAECLTAGSVTTSQAETARAEAKSKTGGRLLFLDHLPRTPPRPNSALGEASWWREIHVPRILFIQPLLPAGSCSRL